MDTTTLIDRVRIALEQQGTECPIEEIVRLCPDLTWNHWFLAIDFLSRTGQVRVTLDAGRSYKVQAYRPVGGVCVPVSQQQ